jgi:hypothetical protein
MKKNILQSFYSKSTLTLLIVLVSLFLTINSGCDFSDPRSTDAKSSVTATSLSGQINLPQTEDRRVLLLNDSKSEFKLKISGENLASPITVQTNTEGKFKIPDLSSGNYLAEITLEKNSTATHLGEITFTVFPEENNCFILNFNGFDESDLDDDKRFDEMILQASFFTDNNEDFIPDSEYLRTVNQDRSSKTIYSSDHLINHYSDGTSRIVKKGVVEIINDADDDLVSDSSDVDDDNDGIPDSQDNDHFNNGIIDQYEDVRPDNYPPEFTLVNLKNNKDDIQFEFFLSDKEKDTSYIKVEYRGGTRGSIWTDATFTGEVNNIESDSLLKIGKWQSATDQPGMRDENYQLKFTPFNTNSNVEGTAVLSEVFSVDNSNVNTPPNVKVTNPNGGEVLTGMKTVTWLASDMDPDNFIQTTELAYSLEDNDWQVFYSTLGNPGYYNWDTSSLINSSRYRVRVRCYDGTDYTNDISDDYFAISNTGSNMFPRVANVSITGTSGEINVKYDLFDDESDICSIRVEYKGGIAGTQWCPASITGTTSGLAPAGNLSLIWNSKADEPLMYSEDYVIRITPIDSNAWGLEGTSAVFKIDNR